MDFVLSFSHSKLRSHPGPAASFTWRYFASIQPSGFASKGHFSQRPPRRNEILLQLQVLASIMVRISPAKWGTKQIPSKYATRPDYFCN